MSFTLSLYCSIAPLQKRTRFISDEGILLRRVEGWAAYLNKNLFAA